jgi:AcrR family transcriptional regulator
MTGLNRKARERLEREMELIDIAREIIESEGLASLTMDKVTERCDYSKGTVYNHFSCKEDLLVAVSNEGLKDLQSIFNKLENFQGNTREQMLGLQLAYLYFSKLYPSQFLCVLSVKNPAILSRTSEKRKQQQLALEIALDQQGMKIINKAIANKELQLPKGSEAKQVSFANWSQSFGALVLVNAAESLVGLQGIDIGTDFFANAFVLNDGFQWQPLSSEYNYFAAIDTLKKSVYFEEENMLTRLQNNNKIQASM